MKAKQFITSRTEEARTTNKTEGLFVNEVWKRF